MIAGEEVILILHIVGEEVILIFHIVGEEVILKRDTQREDEIKSIKAAWEELQPGRAAKVNTFL